MVEEWANLIKGNSVHRIRMQTDVPKSPTIWRFPGSHQAPAVLHFKNRPQRTSRNYDRQAQTQ